MGAAAQPSRGAIQDRSDMVFGYTFCCYIHYVLVYIWYCTLTQDLPFLMCLIQLPAQFQPEIWS